jgi:hypothetical protein
MSLVEALPGLQASQHRRHALHGEEAVWAETNCYADLWIELLHALRLEPRAMLPFTLAVDFIGDQWTFFKPPLGELFQLYGIDVQELTVWRPLAEHAVEHLAAGRLICTEADAWWLPDTAGTDYRNKHTKTTIALASIDVAREQLTYFHNAGCFALEGEDFRQLFRIGAGDDPAHLPFFAEVVSLERRVERPVEELAALSLQLLRKHFARRPRSNPLARFGVRFAQELPALQQAGLVHYHAWAFASVRQAGAAFALAAAGLRWLAGQGEAPGLAEAAGHFDAIAQANKALILKGARAVNGRKPFDAGPMMEAMARDWEQGMGCVEAVLGAATAWMPDQVRNDNGLSLRA